MTESQWLDCNDPQQMLQFLKGKASDRKLRLFACACCRSVWLSLPVSTKGAVLVVERFIEGQVDDREFGTQVISLAAQSSEQERELLLGLAYYHGTIYNPDHITALRQLMSGCTTAKGSAPATARRSRQVLMLQDIFSPFRPDRAVPADWLRWHSGTVSKLAHAAYDNRRLPSGTLALDRFLILADALEDAGCDDQDILGHLRGPGLHTRGCWVLDLLTGRE